MLQIIKKQQRKSLGEIMYEVNNEKSYKSFHLKEKITKYIFIVCTCGLVIFSLIKTYQFYSDETKDFSDSDLMVLFLIEVLLPYVFLCTTLFILLCYMGKYHSFERKKIQFSLKCFVLFESFDLVVFIIQDVFDLGRNTHWSLFTNIDLYLGGYILI